MEVFKILFDVPWIFWGIILFVICTTGIPWIINMKEAKKRNDEGKIDDLKDDAKVMIGAIIMTIFVIGISLLVVG
jgi:cbb3-type cytochrome oxidase subunit 3